jgi:hypothetical protein
MFCIPIWCEVEQWQDGIVHIGEMRPLERCSATGRQPATRYQVGRKFYYKSYIRHLLQLEQGNVLNY